MSTTTQENKRGIRQFREGMVVEDALAKKNMKTVTVEVQRLAQHRQYKKYIRRYKRFLVHDEKNECRMGDRVEIVMTRPISKLKHWKVSRIVEKAQ